MNYKSPKEGLTQSQSWEETPCTDNGTIREFDAAILHFFLSPPHHFHFSTDDRPVLLEVLDASEFLSRLTKFTATAQPGIVMTL